MDISQCGVVAQSVEQQPFKLVVLGSIPSYPMGRYLGKFFCLVRFFCIMEFVVYILKGKRYYVGYTGDLQRRLEEHKRGQTKTTREL